MPTQQRTAAAIRGRVARALRPLLPGQPRPTATKRLCEDYHFSHFDCLELALCLETEFQFTLPDQEIAAFSTVGSVRACVRRYLVG